MSRACLTAVAKSYLPHFAAMLAESGISIAAHQEILTAPIFVLRLEGDGLPEWCQTAGDANYRWVSTLVGNDGMLRFMPCPPLPTDPAAAPSGPGPGEMVEWLKRQLKNPN
jgi:hypothetical protein